MKLHRAYILALLSLATALSWEIGKQGQTILAQSEELKQGSATQSYLMDRIALLSTELSEQECPTPPASYNPEGPSHRTLFRVRYLPPAEQ